MKLGLQKIELDAEYQANL